MELHAGIIFPLGKFGQAKWAIPYLPDGKEHPTMLQTIAETRKARLEQLIQQHGKLADLNVALGYERTATTLARIRNSNERKDRPGKAFQMGDAQAREIEIKLGLPRGWMDTPPGFEALEEPGTRQLLDLFGQLKPEDRAKAVRLLDALAEPAQPGSANGTNG